MKSGGGSKADKQAERALRRKKEEEILSAYEIPDSAPVGRAKSKKKAPGLNRGGYFWLSFALGMVTQLMFQASIWMSGFTPDPDAPIPDDAPVMLLLAFITTCVILFVGQAFLVYLRYENMNLSTNIWRNTAAILSLAPCVLLGLSFIFAAVGVGIIVLVAGILGLISIVLAMPFNMACMILPPQYGQHGKLDGWSWFWLVFTILPFLGFLFAILMLFVF